LTDNRRLKTKAAPTLPTGNVKRLYDLAVEEELLGRRGGSVVGAALLALLVLLAGVGVGAGVLSQSDGRTDREAEAEGQDGKLFHYSMISFEVDGVLVLVDSDDVLVS
jgi:hypothetical protein